MPRLPNPLVWVRLALVSFGVMVLVFLYGVSAGGLDAQEACAAQHQIYDHQYRSENWQEPGRLFPMHDRCNAGYDLVPEWINPALVASGVLMLAFLATGTVLRVQSDGGSRNFGQ